MPAKKKSILLLLSSIFLIAGSCQGTGGSDGGAERQLAAPEEMDDVGPNEARVLATVTAIYEERAARGPCARAACDATVRIDSVLSYGSAFPRPLSSGEHLEVQFAFTLENTEELGLNIDRAHPGLSTGASFWADLQGRSIPGGTSFAVHGYHAVHD